MYITMPLILGSLWALVPAFLTIILLIIRTYLEDNTLQKELKPLLGARVRFMSLATNEELIIARDTYAIIMKGK